MLQVNNCIVSVDWLNKNLEAENLIVLDATIPKVGAKVLVNSDKKIIPSARFFDLKKVFSKQGAKYPNTVLSVDEFQAKAQKLGVNKDCCIIVYDDLGVYSSPRVWWMFTLMGFDNVAVLNGGLLAWEKAGFPTNEEHETSKVKGNFKANFKSEKIKVTKDVLLAIKNDNLLIADARSKGRFYATEPEPRKEVRGGHIPSSINLPYKLLQNEGKMKSTEELKNIFEKINPKKKELIFSCGSGITACILALGAEITGFKNHAVYDGSWTEWGSRKDLPIEK